MGVDDLLSFDWTNVFFLFFVVALLLFAMRTDNGGMRITAHIVIFITLLGLVQPLFALMYGGFAGWHIMGGEV